MIDSHHCLRTVLNDWKRLHRETSRSDLLGHRRLISNLIDRVVGNLQRKEICEFLNVGDADQDQSALHTFAAAVREHYLGNTLKLRAVLEVTNECNVNCNYCEMRHDNSQLERYRLAPEAMVAAARAVHDAGVSTILIQGGEHREVARALLQTVPHIKELGLEIIVCLGNLDTKLYNDLRTSGVDGYILKFESSSQSLHQAATGRSLFRRLQCIDALSALGFCVGSGFICGLPTKSIAADQTELLADDILLVQRRQFSMCSVSPFIPEENTPYQGEQSGHLETTLNAIALLRIANPLAAIPSVSALQQLSLSLKPPRDDGQLRGLNAGANVLTVNFTPVEQRNKYRIYGDHRFVVNLDYAVEIARKTSMTLAREHSLGPYTISKDKQKLWFEGRYEHPAPLGESVYGPITPLLCRFIEEVNPKGKRQARRVVDLGCGDGRVTIPLLLKQCDVFAVDESKAAMRRLRDRAEYFEECTEHLTCKNQNLLDAVPGASRAHGVVLANILYYFSEQQVESILKRSWTCLRDGGVLYISVEIAPRLSIAVGSGREYFHLGSQYNYSIDDVKGFIKRYLRRTVRADDETQGYVETKVLPLPKNVVPDIADTSEYNRTYLLYEVMVRKWR